MRLAPRSPGLLRLLVGQHVVNGLGVSLGVLAVAFVASAVLGFAAGQPATLGAISASISDVPAAWRDKARTFAFGFALAIVATSAIFLAESSPTATVLTVGAIGLVAGLVTALGRWALALGMQGLIPMVFVLGLPRVDFAHALHEEGLIVAGGLGYIAVALIFTRLADASARRLAAGESIREFAAYLRAVADVYDPAVDLEAAYGAAIRHQAALGEQLQSARSILLERANETPERLRLAATIGVLLDAFDALVAAQCDVALIRAEPAAATLLDRIVVALSAAALDLDQLSLELMRTRRPALPPDHEVARRALAREAARLAAAPASPAAEAATSAAERLAQALAQVRRLERALADDALAAEAIAGVELAAFIPRRSFSPRLVTRQLKLESPVLRFSARLGLAMAAGALVALSLGDAGHGNWVLLTIAVVLRSGFGLTRQRRNDRVVGTLIGCVVAAGAVAWLPLGWLVAVQAGALAVTHAFVRLNYRLASTGASVMALVSLHLLEPTQAAPVVARLADTLIGAAIAHLFNYVWPRWEFAEAPRIVARAPAELAGFAAIALAPDVAEQDYRLARKNVIEAIAALSDSAGRMSGEPIAAQRGLEEMAALLIAAHNLVARLSAARLAVKAGGEPTNEATRAALQALLAGKPDPQGPNAPLIDAGRAVMAAAAAYEKAARRR